MKSVRLFLFAILVFQAATAQITLTSGDMPVAGDSLRFSNAQLPDSAISPADSGANVTWNYPLTMVSQGINNYQLAASVNILYAVTVGFTASGYKVADSLPLPGGLPISIQQVYTFFEVKNSPSRYDADAFAANISGIPTAIKYTKDDVWYDFPLTYGSQDSNNFVLNIAIPTLGGIKETGYRKTRVDGWGTITTPYYTTPVNCIRVRSEIHQIDSIPLGTFNIGFPVNTVEYKWLVNGDHYPALWVTSNLGFGGGNEVITSVRYRDEYRDTANVNKVANIAPSISVIKAVPNPTINGTVNLEVPDSWQKFEVEVFDMQSKRVACFHNERQIDISALPAGNYAGRITSGNQTGYVLLVKQ